MIYKKILVIGGAGFIGSHVVDALLREDVEEVMVFDNFTTGHMDNLKSALRRDGNLGRCRIQEGDISRSFNSLYTAIQGKDAVFHLAAAWLNQCEEDPDMAFKVNIQGTYNVLKNCLEHKVKRLIFSSSASVYGNAVEEPMTEKHPYNNWTLYGATKIAGEHMFKAFHKGHGLDGACLRYMNVYGPRQSSKRVYTGVIPKIIGDLENNENPTIYGNGEYDFIDVRDVARANICALKNGSSFGFYNVGTGIKTSLVELAGKILKIYNSEITSCGLGVNDKEFVTNRIGCTKKAEEKLGFKSEIDLEQGLEDYIKWRKFHSQDLTSRKGL